MLDSGVLALIGKSPLSQFDPSLPPSDLTASCVVFSCRAL